MMRSNTIAEDVPAGKALLAQNGRFLEMDDQIIGMLGLTRREATRRYVQDVTHPHDRARDMAQVERLLSRGHGSYSLLKRYIHASGKPIWAEQNVTLNHQSGSNDTALLLNMRQATVCPRALEEVHNKAFRDPVTGLANRHALDEQLAAAANWCKRTQQPFVFAVLDLDGFKKVNDTRGHQIGDALLTAVSQRLFDALEPQDFAARMGGDEFALILYGIRNAQEMRLRIARIRQCLQPTFCLPDGPLQMTASLGWALYPVETDTIPSLVDHADRAMYRAKRALTSEQARMPPLKFPDPAAKG